MSAAPAELRSCWERTREEYAQEQCDGASLLKKLEYEGIGGCPLTAAERERANSTD